ncbi:MAG TPA: alkaline phosphatase family protein [Terracidiphilus sp.]|nr:alkaline phosphatase family protein [Terracidiphilus sp.]
MTETKAASIKVTGSNGTSYTLPYSGGTITVSPTSTTTYTATATNSSGSTTAQVTVTVGAAGPTVSITAQNNSITPGSSDTLTVTATNATNVVVTGSDGSSYTLSSSGGTVTVTPTETTTYTAEATNSSGTTASAETTVDVGSTAGLSSIQHVVFMLQENHSFDDYFGMLNVYRHDNGWDVSEDGKTYNVDGIDDKLDTIKNEDDEGTYYYLYKFRTTCIDDDSSAWLSSYGDVNRYNFATTRPIKMDGYVHTAEGFAKYCVKSPSSCSGNFTDTTGERAMGYYDQDYLNYYYYIASQFAVSDRWFSPISSNSIPNRIATFTGGTTQGLVYPPGADKLPQLNINNIFEELQNAGVSWKIYYTVTDGGCTGGTACGSGNGNLPDTTFSSLTYANKFILGNPTHAACPSGTQPSSVWGDTSNYYCVDPRHIAPLSQYYTDVKNNTLPAFSFIESGSGRNDEHPGSGQSILVGQAEVAKIVNALMVSASWSSSAFFFSYDEGGGPYDHVPPVPGHSNDFTDSSLGSIPDISGIAVNPDSYKPCVPSGTTPTLHCDLKTSEKDPGTVSTDAPAQQGFRAQLGFRVPNFVVSPFVRKHYVSHIPMDHTAIIKFAENRFISSSTHLTARDAAQPNLLDFFDFSGKPWATPPTPPTPTSVGSSCQPEAMGP